MEATGQNSDFDINVVNQLNDTSMYMSTSIVSLILASVAGLSDFSTTALAWLLSTRNELGRRSK
jgi:flagellar biosynthesis component FlhA